MLCIPVVARVPAPVRTKSFGRPRRVGVVLGTPARHIADASAQEYPRAHADRPIERILQKRRELAGAAIVRISEMWFQQSHVGMNDAIRDVHRHVVVLVRISRIEQIGFVHRLLVDVSFDLSPGIAVGPVSMRDEPNIFPPRNPR